MLISAFFETHTPPQKKFQQTFLWLLAYAVLEVNKAEKPDSVLLDRNVKWIDVMDCLCLK